VSKVVKFLYTSLVISTICLTDFRNFDKKEINFSDKTTIIVGPNASGKTNILESIYLLSTGKSFKARIEGEMIRYDSDLTRIVGVLQPDVGSKGPGPASRQPQIHPQGDPGFGAPRLESPDKTTLEVVITTGENGWPKKKLLVNGIPKRMVDFAGNFKTVLFGPWDMDLVTESPTVRRRFLDNMLSQTDREYRRSILSYEKGVRQRNKLLWRIKEEGIPRSQLLFWNQLLIKNGDYITLKRQEFIDYCNNNEAKYLLVYDKSVISEGRLEQYKNEEVAAGKTLVGPHRDDFLFKVKEKSDRDLAAFGSRGEQRMGVLWLKMKELDYVEQVSKRSDPDTGSDLNNGSRPTLLLDDIFSELDHEHRDIVMELAGKQQTIITTADPHFVSDMRKVEKIELKG